MILCRLPHDHGNHFFPAILATAVFDAEMGRRQSMDGIGRHFLDIFRLDKLHELLPVIRMHMAFRQLEPLGPGEDRARLHAGDGGKDDIHRILVALVIIEGIENAHHVPVQGI